MKDSNNPSFGHLTGRIVTREHIVAARWYGELASNSSQVANEIMQVETVCAFVLLSVQTSVRNRIWPPRRPD